MSHDPQHEIWNPFCERVDSLSASERADMERGRAWAYYIEGGGGDRSHRRKVYYLAECSKIPIHRLGSTLCLRPSAYKSWIESQENRAVVNSKHNA